MLRNEIKWAVESLAETLKSELPSSSRKAGVDGARLQHDIFSLTAWIAQGISLHSIHF